MSQLANYVFLPWLRQGIGSQIADKDTLGSGNGNADERASLQVDVTLQDTAIDGVNTNKTVFSKNIFISGPGDVAGIQPRAIVRTEPPANLSNFESNNLAYIEFYEEDFLWRYTPASPNEALNSGQRLRPWLTLVVLKDDEFKLIPNPNGLAFISVVGDKFNDAFHNHTDIWAFGHVHLNHHIANMAQLGQDVSNKLKSSPDSGVSRLLCPRKLTKNTSYTAFLIPSFETGRLGGLGMDTSTVKSQAPSWQKGAMDDPARQRPFDFPFYHQWSFKTGNFGDFESLASILKPTIINGDSSGTLPMDIQNPGYGLNGVAGTNVLGFEGALRPANFESDAFPVGGVADDQEFVDKLKDLLNMSSDLINEAEAENIRQNTFNPFYSGIKMGDDDPIIVPPVYGVWHIMAQKVGAGSNPAWFNTLNLDPRFRAAAGLGTKVVQDHQEDLMNKAWQQIDEVNEANKKIRQAELIKMVANSLFKKHIATASNDKIVALTGPVHSMLTTNTSKTVQQSIKESRIPVAAKSAAFQKLIRPTRKNEKMIPEIRKTIISDFNAANPLTTAKIKIPVLGKIDTSRVVSAITAAVQSYEADTVAMAKDLFFKVAKAQQSSLSTNVANSKTVLNNAVDGVPASEATAAIKTATKNIISEVIQIQVSPTNSLITIITLKEAKYKEIFYTNDKGEDAKSFGTIEVRKEGFVVNPLLPFAVGSVSTYSDVLGYQNNFNQFWGVKATLHEPSLLPQLQNFGNLGIQIKILPQLTFSNRFLNLILDKDKKPLGNLKTIMAYPVFRESVYKYLLELSKDYILPNVDKLERNSISLMETNPKFIESFLLGMNHEMARELLWREYPTDQRGSYFRQFWSIKDSQIFPKPLEELLDIGEVHKWDGALGSNGRGSILVLVIRGELLQKYPDTMIYAQKATYASPDARKPRVLPTELNESNTKFPLFRAEIDPDITLVGFELTAEEAIGHRITSPTESTSGKDPGWFFVLKQRPGHLSFGFDDYIDQHGNTSGTPPAPAKWENLTWENLVDQKSELDNYHLSFNKNFNPPTNPEGYVWNKNAADLAAILFQNPVIFARHAAEMLPEL